MCFKYPVVCIGEKYTKACKVLKLDDQINTNIEEKFYLILHQTSVHVDVLMLRKTVGTVSVWEIQGCDGSIRWALNVWSQQDCIRILRILEQHVMFLLVLQPLYIGQAVQEECLRLQFSHLSAGWGSYFPHSALENGKKGSCIRSTCSRVLYFAH